MKRPNFFIVGAPKCGTSALWKYLRSHPQVVVSSNKEPHYFATDLPTYRAVTTEEDYLALFGEPKAETLAMGEASVFHLFSYTAIPNIRRFNPDAKIIAILRSPIELAYSFHSQLVFSREEDVDFRRAIELLPERARGRHVPRRAREPALLQYLDVVRLGSQIERLYSVFPEDRVKIFLYDDFKRDTRGVYEEVLSFLDVPSDGRTEFPVHNASKRHRFGWLGTIAQKPPKPLMIAAQRLKKLAGIDKLGFMNRVKRYNRVEDRRSPLPPELWTRLADTLRPDVEKLSRLIGRDVTHWLEVPAADAGTSVQGGNAFELPSD